MFNFFDEIKKKTGNLNGDLINGFNLINISGKILYVEGHHGITIISSTMIAFKIKHGRIMVEGEGLFIKELTENTILIQGQIVKVEQF